MVPQKECNSTVELLLNYNTHIEATGKGFQATLHFNASQNNAKDALLKYSLYIHPEMGH